MYYVRIDGVFRSRSVETEIRRGKGMPAVLPCLIFATWILAAKKGHSFLCFNKAVTVFSFMINPII